jgi:hypothetical protein
MGKSIDNYAKNIAAKIANINPNLIKSYELYYDIEDFENIDTFISMISETFKLKGLNVETFITRWIFHFGRGTEYAIDLFTSFCNMIISAYCGAYIVNQKQIEKSCGKSMVKLTVNIMEIASNSLDKSYWSENADDNRVISKESQAMLEAIKMRSALPDYAKINRDDFSSKDIIKTKVKNLTKHYMLAMQQQKISGKLASSARMGIRAMDRTKVTDKYEVGCVEVIHSEGKKYFNDRDKRNLMTDIEQQIRVLTEAMKKDNVRVNKDLRNKISQELSELRRSEGKLV